MKTSKNKAETNQEKSLIEKGFRLSQNLFFKLMQSKAVKLLGKPGKLLAVAQEAFNKTDRNLSFIELPSYLWFQIQTLFSLLKDYAQGKYKELETSKLVLLISSILYLVSPFDAIPDFIPFVGLSDDIAIFAWVISALSNEIKEYQVWKNKQPIEIKSES